jgi:hypothetical protein
MCTRKSIGQMQVVLVAAAAQLLEHQHRCPAVQRTHPASPPTIGAPDSVARSRPFVQAQRSSVKGAALSVGSVIAPGSLRFLLELRNI